MSGLSSPRLVAPLLSALVLSACGFNFQTESLVIDRRILGIAAEPPELIFGMSDFSHPIQVSALVVDPKDTGAPQTFTWSWCLPDLNQQGNYDPVAQRCIEQSSSQVAQGSAPLSAMATTFTPTTALSSLGAFTGGGGMLSGLGGQPGKDSGVPTDGLSTYLMFQLDVQGDADSHGPLFGIKRVVLSTPGPGNRQPNKNPHLTALTFDDQIWEPDTPLPVKLKQCTMDNLTTVTDPRNGAKVQVCQHRIFPVFDPGQAETYQVQTFTQDAQGTYEVLTLQEMLTFGWLTDNGSFTSEFTGSQSNLGPQKYDPYSTDWIEPAEITSRVVNFWVIVQDDRGGESWELRQLLLSE